MRSLAALAVLALAVAGASLAREPLPQGSDLWRLVGLGALFVAGFFALQRTSFTYLWKGERHRTVLDEVAIYLGFVALPGALVVLLVPVCGLVEQALVRRTGLKAVYNLSQNVLSALPGWAAFAGLHAAGAHPLLAALPAAFLYPLASYFLGAGLLARLNARPFASTFAERFLRDALLSGSVGAGAGVAVAVLAAFHPLVVLALLPFVYLSHRHSVLAAVVDQELEVRKRVSEVARDLAGTKRLDVAADRILTTLGEVLPACGSADLVIAGPEGEVSASRDFSGGAAPGATATVEEVPGRTGRLGTLRVRPRRATSGFSEAERELLKIVAAQAGAAIEATRALAETEGARARLDAYLAAAGDGVLLVDREGAVRYMNPAARRLFGAEAADDGSVRAADLFPDPALLAPGKDRESALVETRAFDLARTREMLVEAHATLLPGRDGAGGVLVVVRDATERKRLEAETARQREALARQEKLSALGTLVAGVAHEINNPVVYMRGALELAALDLEDLARLPDATPETRALAERSRARLRTLAEGVGRVDRITHALKAVARQGNGDRRLEDVNGVAADVAQVVGVALPRGVHLKAALAPTPRVLANASELHQVVLNLVKNAVEALADRPEGGNVTLATRCQGDRVLVEVSDDGPGIAPDLQRRLFEPFFTTKPAGTGLGLSLARGIAEAHGGDLTLASVPGEGTRFTLSLPVPPK